MGKVSKVSTKHKDQDDLYAAHETEQLRRKGQSAKERDRERTIEEINEKLRNGW